MLVGLEKNLRPNMSKARDRSLTGRLSLQRDPGPEHVGNSDRGGTWERRDSKVGGSWQQELGNQARPDTSAAPQLYKRGAIGGRQTS